MTTGSTPVETVPTSVLLGQLRSRILPSGTFIKALLGPTIGLLIWWLPLTVNPSAHLALAIAGFMFVYWVTETIEPGMTALLGCFLLWALQVVPAATAFSGFASATPWYLFGALLMSKAASQSGLGKRLATLVMRVVGISYSRLLLSLTVLVVLLQFVIPNGAAQLAIVAPLVVGIITTFRLEPNSNMAKGLFIIATYACSIFNKMIMSGGSTILARGVVEEITGVPILWSQWFIAFLPITLLTIVACWLTIRWLYPAETALLVGDTSASQVNLLAGSDTWSQEEKVTLIWLLFALLLWATDFLHHTNPALIALGVGLFLVLPKIGLLDTQAIKSVNLLLIIFVGGTLGMGNVLIETKALSMITDRLSQWMPQLMSDSLSGAITVYWGGFLYHFLLASEYAMASTGLPILLDLGREQGYNPVVLCMLWSFAGTGKLFIYQNSILILGYSYGYFTARDMLKVGGILTLIEGVFLMILVPVYWPMVGLHWTTKPPSQIQSSSKPVNEAPVFTSVINRALDEQSDRLLSAAPPGRLSAAPLLSIGLKDASPTHFEPHVEDWHAIKNSMAPLDFAEFLEMFPSSRFATRARKRLRQIQCQPPPAPVRELHVPSPAVTSLHVRYAQLSLRLAGFSPGTIDGICGMRTVIALRQYQASREIPVTGTLDTATQQALQIPSPALLEAWHQSRQHRYTSPVQAESMRKRIPHAQKRHGLDSSDRHVQAEL